MSFAWAMSRATMIVPVQGDGGGDGILRKRGQGFLGMPLSRSIVHAREFPVAVFLGNEAAGILLELLEEDAVLGDLRLGLAVGGAGNADADRAGGAVAWQADDAHIEREILAAELRADADRHARASSSSFSSSTSRNAGRVRCRRSAVRRR
ncbi:MAG: hypothetical protein QM755_05945 [Luteolibacter sp.]